MFARTCTDASSSACTFSCCEQACSHTQVQTHTVHAHDCAATHESLFLLALCSRTVCICLLPLISLRLYSFVHQSNHMQRYKSYHIVLCMKSCELMCEHAFLCHNGLDSLRRCTHVETITAPPATYTHCIQVDMYK